MAVGLNASGNDRMRKEWAGKDDWWIHATHGVSPHVIVKLKSSIASVIDPEILRLAGSCLAEYMNDRIEVDLIYTKVNMLKGVKGTPGKVTYKSEKHFRVYVDKNWKNLI